MTTSHNRTHSFKDTPQGAFPPTKGQDSGRKKKRKTKKVSAAKWAELKVAFVSGIALRELARKTGIPTGTILSRSTREGWAKQIQGAKALAPLDDSLPVTQAVTATRRERGERYQDRMSGVVERMLPHLEKLHPEELLEQSAEIDRLDKVGRRNFGLDDSREATQPTINIALLAAGLDGLLAKPILDVTPRG
jgi:hypothetical protein